MTKNLYKYLLFVALGFLIACNPARRLGEGEYLLNKNKLLIDSKDITTDNLEGLIKQLPNKKIIRLFRFNLRVYNFANRGKERKYKKWLKNTIGEPPVIIDTNLTNASVANMKSEMFNKGYFNAQVSKSIKIKKQKRQASISYNIISGKPYTINTINTIIDDQKINAFLLTGENNSLIKPGMPYNVDVLDAERERITKLLKNNGYFYFSKDYLQFEIDSALNSHKVNIDQYLKGVLYKKGDNSDSNVYVNHKRYYVNKIFVLSEYDTRLNDTVPYDTLKVSVQQSFKKNNLVEYYFLHHQKKFRIHPKAIAHSIFIHPDEQFVLNDIDQTYNSLNELRNFKYVNIMFGASPDTVGKENKNLLDCYIFLNRMQVHSISFEGEGTNSSGDLGVAGNIVYQNKNLFRGAEIFRVKIKGALELQQIFKKNAQIDNNNQFLFFNTYETGGELSIEFPRFLFPFFSDKFPRSFKPKTVLSTGYNFQQRPDYRRHIMNLTLGYNWKQSSTVFHTLTLSDINLVRIFPEASFVSFINGIIDPYLRNQYTNHLVNALRYVFFYSNQQVNKVKDFVYFRTSLETAGNVPYLINSIAKSTKNSQNNYEIFNVPYSQYLLLDVDFRYYDMLNATNSMVWRAAIGYGLPYGNINVLPFEKSFFVGGSNSLRAWKLKQLGPGSYNDTSNVFDKVGDVKIELNFESRFPIYSILKGAFFIDAGNIWFNQARKNVPGGEFRFDRFYQEIAIGAGLGIRLDISFFVIRLDAALPIREPTKPLSQRWVVLDSKFSDIVLSFGIGYPF